MSIESLRYASQLERAIEYVEQLNVLSRMLQITCRTPVRLGKDVTFLHTRKLLPRHNIRSSGQSVLNQSLFQALELRCDSRGRLVQRVRILADIDSVVLRLVVDKESEEVWP